MLLLLFDIVGDVVVEAVYTCGICDVWSYSFISTQRRMKRVVAKSLDNDL